jgi:DNA-directed RNA polymerase subunit M/transcription elongation factor TFIIS
MLYVVQTVSSCGKLSMALFQKNQNGTSTCIEASRCDSHAECRNEFFHREQIVKTVDILQSNDFMNTIDDNDKAGIAEAKRQLKADDAQNQHQSYGTMSNQRNSSKVLNYAR